MIALIIEEDIILSQNICESMNHKFEMVQAFDGEEGLNRVFKEDFDIIILDVMMPKINGYEVLEKMRDASNNTPVLMLTALNKSTDQVKGLRAGADDYLVKPFEFAELLARLRALGRRTNQKIQQEVIRIGEFILNRTAKEVHKGGQVIQLSPREFQIFDLLVQNAGIVVPRDVILDRIWGLESEVSSNNIDSYVKLLRKKIDPGAGDPIIHTIRGVGYKLEAKG